MLTHDDKNIYMLCGASDGELCRAKQLAESGDGVKLSYASRGDGVFVAEPAFEGFVSPSQRNDALEAFEAQFAGFIYAQEDVTPQQALVALLKRRKLVLCSAESFTGGRIASSVVQVAGASEVFYEGIVCYNTNSKINRLGVDSQTVDRYTVVSKQVAAQMVEGLIKTGNCDVAVATTGYASPVNDETIPDGLFYIAVGNKKSVKTYRFVEPGSRSHIINFGANMALTILINFINANTF